MRVPSAAIGSSSLIGQSLGRRTRVRLAITSELDITRHQETTQMALVEAPVLDEAHGSSNTIFCTSAEEKPKAGE
jgi:hypothetical protein